MAELRFGDATRIVAGSRFEQLPLSPVWKNFVRLGETFGVEREALSQAILLQNGGVIFKPGKVAPTWTIQQRWTSRVRVNAGSTQESEDGYFLLLLHARVLEDIDAFFADDNQ